MGRMLTVSLHGPAALRRVAAMPLVALLGACASLTVTDTVPLSPSALAPLDSDSISIGGYRLSALQCAGLCAGPAGAGRHVRRGQAVGVVRLRRAEGHARGEGAARWRPAAAAAPGLGDRRRVGRQFSGGVLRPVPRRDIRQVRDRFSLPGHRELHLGHLPAAVELDMVSDPLVGTNDFMERVYDRDHVPWRDVSRPRPARPSGHRRRRHRPGLWHIRCCSPRKASI